jgi:hypothetical protein
MDKNIILFTAARYTHAASDADSVTFDGGSYIQDRELTAL